MATTLMYNIRFTLVFSPMMTIESSGTKRHVTSLCAFDNLLVYDRASNTGTAVAALWAWGFHYYSTLILLSLTIMAIKSSGDLPLRQPSHPLNIGASHAGLEAITI